MITFLQQSLSNRNTFATVNDPTKATHFQKNGGPIKIVSELSENINDLSEVEPLEILNMNFGDEKTNNYSMTDTVEPLEIPSIF